MATRGLVLSGGGARGIAHLGVLKALDEYGIQFDYLSGTSAGAIVASMYSYGYSPDDILRIIQEARFFKSLKMAWTWTGLLDMDGLSDLLLRYMPENDFKRLAIPVTVAATEIQQGVTHYFSEGELIPAILASCCVPAVFKPLTFQGGMYVDGGVLDNLPVAAIADKCSFLAASHCNFVSPGFEIKNLRSVVERSLLMAINGNTTVSKSRCQLLIDPPEAGAFSGFDLARARELFDIGYTYTRKNVTPDDFLTG